MSDSNTPTDDLERTLVIGTEPAKKIVRRAAVDPAEVLKIIREQEAPAQDDEHYFVNPAEPALVPKRSDDLVELEEEPLVSKNGSKRKALEPPSLIFTGDPNLPWHFVGPAKFINLPKVTVSRRGRYWIRRFCSLLCFLLLAVLAGMVVLLLKIDFEQYFSL